MMRTLAQVEAASYLERMQGSGGLIQGGL